MPQQPHPFESLRSAAQYVRRFRHHPFVVKLGGEILDDPALRRSVCEQLALLWSFSIPLVIVHGGGCGLDQLCESMGLETRKVAGRRVTSPEVLDAAKMAFKGKIQMDFISDLEAAGMPAVGLSGQDAGLIKGISQSYFSGDVVSRSDAREVAAAWAPYCSVATWYIWRSLDPVSVAY